MLVYMIVSLDIPLPCMVITATRHYAANIANFCSGFKPAISDHVVTTGSAYFKRYCLMRSVLDHPPARVARLCVFLACQAEEVAIELSTL